MDIEVMETVWVELPDGARLAARIWLPQDARTSPVLHIGRFSGPRPGP